MSMRPVRRAPTPSLPSVAARFVHERRRSAPVRTALSSTLAALASLALVASTSAASWIGHIPLRTGDCFDGIVGVPGGLATLDGNAAVVIYSGEEPSGSAVAVRRSTDSGMTWHAPTILSTESAGKDVRL